MEFIEQPDYSSHHNRKLNFFDILPRNQIRENSSHFIKNQEFSNICKNYFFRGDMQSDNFPTEVSRIFKTNFSFHVISSDWRTRQQSQKINVRSIVCHFHDTLPGSKIRSLFDVSRKNDVAIHSRSNDTFLSKKKRWNARKERNTQRFNAFGGGERRGFLKYSTRF